MRWSAKAKQTSSTLQPQSNSQSPQPLVTGVQTQTTLKPHGGEVQTARLQTGQCQIMQTANTLGLYPQHTPAGNPTAKQLMISKTRQGQPPVAISIRAKLADALGCDNRRFCILSDCQ